MEAKLIFSIEAPRFGWNGIFSRWISREFKRWEWGSGFNEEGIAGESLLWHFLYQSVRIQFVATHRSVGMKRMYTRVEKVYPHCYIARRERKVLNLRGATEGSPITLLGFTFSFLDLSEKAWKPEASLYQSEWYRSWFDWTRPFHN